MDHNGYDLFMEVEDTDLRTRNRAVVLFNIYEDHTRNGMTNPEGLVQMMQYIQKLPEEDQPTVVSTLSLMLEPRPVQ